VAEDLVNRRAFMTEGDDADSAAKGDDLAGSLPVRGILTRNDDNHNSSISLDRGINLGNDYLLLHRIAFNADQ